MTPKEKAKELFNAVDYLVNGDINKRNQIDIALWCVDEIMKNEKYESILIDILSRKKIGSTEEYWQEVKQEIEKL